MVFWSKVGSLLLQLTWPLNNDFKQRTPSNADFFQLSLYRSLRSQSVLELRSQHKKLKGEGSESCFHPNHSSSCLWPFIHQSPCSWGQFVGWHPSLSSLTSKLKGRKKGKARRLQKRSPSVMRTAGHQGPSLPQSLPVGVWGLLERPLIQWPPCSSLTHIQMQMLWAVWVPKSWPSKAGGGRASAQQVQCRLEKQWHFEDPL